MAKFNFPRNPGTDRENAFKDAEGQNPFSDGQPPPAEPITENVFATPASAEDRPYTEGDFQEVLVPSANTAFWLAVAGVALSGLGVVCAGAAIAVTANWSTPLFFALPVQFAALAVALPAWIIAARDLRAMRAGAMSKDSLRRCRLAYWMGCFGTLMGALPVMGYFGLWIAYFLSSF